MATQDTYVTIVPYFKVHEGKLEAFKALCERFVAQTMAELQCLYYGFSFCGDEAFCREGYENAEAALTHLDRVAPLLQESLKISEIVRLEVHGSEAQLAKLRGPLASLDPKFFALEYGFRR